MEASKVFFKSQEHSRKKGLRHREKIALSPKEISILWFACQYVQGAFKRNSLGISDILAVELVTMEAARQLLRYTLPRPDGDPEDKEFYEEKFILGFTGPEKEMLRGILAIYINSDDWLPETKYSYFHKADIEEMMDKLWSESGTGKRIFEGKIYSPEEI